jgi:hypothetical protein
MKLWRPRQVWQVLDLVMSLSDEVLTPYLYVTDQPAARALLRLGRTRRKAYRLIGKLWR